MASFKLDLSALPTLTPSGDNYTEWRAAWTIAFKYSELYDVVNGETTRPSTRDSSKEWDTKDTKAMVMLISAVDKDLTIMVTSCESSPAAWAYLAEQFDRDTSNLTIYQFRSLTSLRYADGDDLKRHINTFHQLWVKLSKKCHASTQPVAKAMKPMFASDDVKGAFFLSTLPDTMDHIIDGFSTREITKFTDMEPKILDISEKYTLDSTSGESKAYSTHARSLPIRLNQPSTPRTKSCTWCRKHNFHHQGHTYQECIRLRQYQQEKDDKEVSEIGGMAKARVDKDDGSDSGTEVMAF